jgi:hypothetical protein
MPKENPVFQELRKLNAATRLTSAPLIIPSDSFGFTRPNVNKQHLGRLLADPSLKDLKIGSIVLNRVGTSTDFILFTHARGLLTYYSQVSKVDTDIQNFKKAMTQTLVWRSAGDAPDGVTVAVFGWIIKKYGAIYSDSYQTLEGKRFWLGRLKWALNSGKQALLVQDQTLLPLTPDDLAGIADPHSLLHAWGSNEAYARFRFVISQKAIS